MTDFVALDETTQLGVDRIATSPTALALYRNLLAAAEGKALASGLYGWGLSLLASGSVSGAATLDIVAPFSAAAYAAYRLLLHSVQPATDITSLYLRTSTDGGSSFATSAYQWTAFATDTAAASGAAGGTAAAQMLLSGTSAMGNQAGEISSYVIELLGMHDAAVKTHVFSRAAFVNNTPVFEQILMTGERSVAENNNALRILASSGNISLKWSLFGLWGQI